MGSRTTDWRPGPTVCRCCFSEGCYKDISTEYFWMGKREVYQEMLSETFTLSIAYSQSSGPNSHSRLICEPCISRLRDASDFKRQVLECEKMFMAYLDPSSSVAETTDTEVPVESIDAQVKLERVKEEKPVSDDDFDERGADFHDEQDDDDDDMDDQPLTRLASKVPKKESEDIMELLDTSKTGTKRKSSSKAKTPAAKKSKSKKEAKATSSKAPKPEKKKKGDASAPDVRDNVVSVRVIELVKTGELRKRVSRTSAVALIRNTNACPFKFHRLFMCLYCRSEFVSMPELMQHTKTEHSSVNEDEIRNAIIKLGHCQPIKVNMPDYNCKLCSNEILNFNDLKHHLANEHKKLVDPGNDGVLPYRILGNEYSCALCSKSFENYSRLNSHINEHYTNYVCDQCGSGFASELRLRAHAASHEFGQYPCDHCGKVFSKLASKRDHVKSVHMKAKRNKCMFCKESFRDFYQKQKHLLTVHGIEKKEYKCNFCSKVFVTSSNLRAHEKSNHLKINTYLCDSCDYTSFSKYGLTRHMICHTDEKNHKCQVCKKTYARRKTLTEHMKIHNNDRRFVCQYCERAFVQKCSLKGHLKTHHKDMPNLP